MTIKIFNLSLNVTDTDVQKMFTRYGIVDAVTVDRNKFDGRSKGNAVVDMPVEKEAKMASCRSTRPWLTERRYL
jgi:RNA recognition motif-containing protein